MPSRRRGRKRRRDEPRFFSDRDDWIHRWTAFVDEVTERGRQWTRLTCCSVPTRRFVPRPHVDTWSRLLRAALELSLDRAAPEQASLLLVALPGLVLGHSTLAISIQVAHVLEGEFQPVWNALEEKALLLQRPPPLQGPEAVRRRVAGRRKQALKLAHLGRLSDAARRLQATEMAPFTEATWRQLQELFPTAADVDAPAEIVDALGALLQTDNDTLKRRWDPKTAADEGLLSIVARLPQGKSPGPSGLRAEHLQGATQQTQVVLIRVLRQLATAPENFSPLLRRALSSSRLLPVAKPAKDTGPQERPGVRPIGVPEVLRKVATQWTLRAVMDRVRELLVPLQLGIGVSGGCERSLHAIQAHLSCVPDSVVLRLDLENAFNRIDRKIAQKLVLQHFPELAAVYRLGYGDTVADSPTLCGWRTTHGESPLDTTRLTLQAATGVQQGDPLGPVLHALALAPFLKALRSKFPDLTIVAIHDDITLVGELQTLKEALIWGRDMLPSLGARLQLGKCTLYGQSLNTARVINREIPGVTVTRDGVTIHSIPLGNRQYIEQECLALQNKHEALFREISHLPQAELGTQLALFRYCAETRLDYILRCLAYQFGRTLAREADERTKYHLEVLFGGLSTPATEDDEFLRTVYEQIALPCRWGGLGFATRTRIQPVAFFSAWTQTFQSNSGEWPFITELQRQVDTAPLDPGATSSSTENLANQICASARAVQRRLRPETHPRIQRLVALPDSREACPGDSSEARPAWNNGSIQQTLSREVHHCAFQSLVSNPRISRENRARIRSAAGSGSGVWLREIPVWQPKKLSSTELQVNIRQLLGLPIPGLRTTEKCTSCRSTHGTNGVQRFHHCPTSTGLWQRRHDEICTEVARWLNRWNFIDVQQEPQRYFENYGLRPDIVATHPRTFQRYALDVTVVSPLKGKYLNRSESESGYGARVAENWKIAHYREAMAVDRPEDKFVPIAIETFGRTGKLAQDFLKDSCKHLLHRSEELSNVRSQLNRRLWQGNAEIALGALRVDQLDNPLVPLFSLERSLRPR